jgi:hypothetical protein
MRIKKVRKASEMAAQEIDRLIDPSEPEEERQRRKRRLIKGPKQFRDVRGNRPKLKWESPRETRLTAITRLPRQSLAD